MAAMGTRVAVNSAVFAFLWSLLSFLYLFANLRYVPVDLAAIAVLVGVLAGAILGFAVAKRQLKFLTQNGETRVALSTILFLVGGMLIFFSFWFFFAFNAPVGAQATVISFIYPTLPAYLASEAILFLRWEHKNRKLILASMWTSRLYVSPKTQ